MKSLYNESIARKYKKSPLQLRVYTSQLLGHNPNLVLHGGGNTSVKTSARNRFGEIEELLYIKGSGWDLATIETEGFAPVKMDALLKMAKLKKLTDSEMVRLQRSAMTDPSAPNPSVEAILHATIPFRYVDHTHADAVVTVSNSKDGLKRIKEIYGNRVLIVPYVMPGFILARKVYEMTQNIDWSKLDGIILMHHGVFSFDDDAKRSYEKMIRLVSQAERYLKKKKAVVIPRAVKPREDLLALARIRRAVSDARGKAMIAKLQSNKEQISFSKLSNVSSIATRGPLTPDHVIRTKRVALVLNANPLKDVSNFSSSYRKYFQKNKNGKQVCLDSAPRWAVWPGYGTISFGNNIQEAQIISDITNHTITSIQQAQKLGGWRALSEKNIFDIEYWELEQAKLKKAGTAPALQGKVAIVTGAASGIGRACVESLNKQGAAVVALDINPRIRDQWNQPDILALICDVSQASSIEKSVKAAVREFGGIDILISNAGTFPASEEIERMDPQTWQKSMEVNLSSHQTMLKACIPYLSLGVDPAVIFVASKNVRAPGPGVSAYSVAKAGLTQLARVAALELAPSGIRVNVVHPNAVFDTAIWTKDVLSKRARSYGISVKEYKKSNLLHVEVTSRDVAELVTTMAGPVFSKTTGSQVSIDGGNDRVI